MKKLFLLFHGRFPGEKAASLFAAKSAEAFAGQGMDVEVIVPKRKGIDAQTAYDYFGIKKSFKITELPTVDLFGSIPNKLAFWVSYFSFSCSVKKYLSAHVGAGDVIYSNETMPLLAAAKVSQNIFYEMHDFPESKLCFFKKFLKKVRFMLVHNKWKMEKVRQVFGFPEEKILFEPNAVDIDAFDQKISTEEARRKLGLPVDKKIAVYTGHLYGWKGVDTLAQAAEMVGDDFLTIFVGGTDRDVAMFREKYGQSPRIMITGHKKHSEIPLWQKAADMLVLPNSGKQAISLYYTSPMKLFEYMASRKPIIASLIPSIREIVDEKSALLVNPDDALTLAGAMTVLARDVKKGNELAANAFSAVSDHTWDKRAARIVEFINKKA